MIDMHDLMASGTAQQIEDAKAGDFIAAVMSLRNGREAIHRLLNDPEVNILEHDRLALDHLLHCLLQFAQTEDIEASFFLKRGRGAPKKMSKIRMQAVASMHMKNFREKGENIGKAQESTAGKMGISVSQVEKLTRGTGRGRRSRKPSAE